MHYRKVEETPHSDLRVDLHGAVRNAPNNPGVYFFYGELNLPHYIGKAVDLRRRLLQHFPAKPIIKLRPSRQQVAASGTRNISWFETETELHALLLEDRMIKQLRPAINKQQKKFLLQQYLSLEPNGEVKIIDARDIWDQDPSANELYPRIFGPFKDRFLVQDLLRIDDRYFGAERRTDFVAFLDGTDDAVLERITNEMTRLAKLLRFEEAEREKQRLAFCRRYLEHQVFYNRFVNEALVIETKSNTQTHTEDRNTWIVYRGDLVGHHSHWVSKDEIDEQVKCARASRRGPAYSDWILLDRSEVVHRWIRSRRYLREYRFLG